MDPEDYGLELLDFDDGLDDDLYDDYEDEDDEDGEEWDAYGDGEVDDMLDALMDDSLGDDEDLAERRRRRRRRRRRGRKRKSRRSVRTARGRTAYRPPVMKAYVTQKQLKTALARVGRETKRNATGIKGVNRRVGKLDNRVDGVVSVNRVQSGHIAKMNKLMKLDGALEFAESIEAVTDGFAIDPYKVFRGALKSGMLGDPKGAMGNPMVIGGIGVLLNRPEVLSGILGRS